MNTQNDFLDNVVDDEFDVDSAGTLNAEMCSSLQSDTEKMCSSLRGDTCGDYCGTTKARYVEVLEFTHFVTMFEFDGGGHFRGNKHLITKINCSVVLDLGWGNTQEDLYTIEDRPKGES